MTIDELAKFVLGIYDTLVITAIKDSDGVTTFYCGIGDVDNVPEEHDFVPSIGIQDSNLELALTELWKRLETQSK